MIFEIEKNLFRILISSPIPLLKPPVNLYFFAGQDGLLWDAGYGSRSDIKKVMKALETISQIMDRRGESCRVSRILVSHGHGDHFAGLYHLRRLTGAKILLTSAMAKKIHSAEAYRKAWQKSTGFPQPRPPALTGLVFPLIEWVQEKTFGMHWINNPDEIIAESGVLQAGNRRLSWFPIPGHSDDHLGLYDGTSGFLFSGDQVLRTITPWLGPPGGSIKAYETSLKKLGRLKNLKKIFPAHGSPIEEPQKHLNQALAHSRKRTRKVSQEILNAGNHGISFYRLLKKLYPKTSAVTRISAEGWVLLTLHMLMEEKKIRAEKNKGKWQFFTMEKDF
ncbi:glyoxylase-like metal-dependent hydrolase (beta-lactamase superfamily II) [Desulfobotulus alkaliphilus]|uniref:Glyoxylase-like metal-dependent hydrolase (Beta-lactamase superfamily II) n=1 Tax=Desulfobotulus alkaliphilus TaxID=622671 RepID=A0A562R9R0_9BACT|nr:MBL fold metallo-hydrolase [Desulfobotulus alkaliphilus]TWI65792.1 glyoxylase-like metal-dependent hydrolase (beta-lactamase superfamily II) [Desulfobotulus alkaliphilus]